MLVLCCVLLCCVVVLRYVTLRYLMHMSYKLFWTNAHITAFMFLQVLLFSKHSTLLDVHSKTPAIWAKFFDKTMILKPLLYMYVSNNRMCFYFLPIIF